MCFPSAAEASWCISCVCSRGTDGSTLKQAQTVLQSGHYSGLQKTVDISNNSILRSLWWKWMTSWITSSLSFPLHKNSTLVIGGFKSISYLAVVMQCALLFTTSLGKERPPTLTMLNSPGEQYCNCKEKTARARTQVAFHHDWQVGWYKKCSWEGCCH